MATMKIQADAVQIGDYLTGLDNGYVFMAPEDAEDVLVFISGGQYASVGQGITCITYHDAQGEECHVILPNESMLTVERH